MKKHILLITVVLAALLLAGSASAAGDVRINEKNFPDEFFRMYVEGVIDTNGDGILSQTEIENVTSINVYCFEIKDMTGLSLFTELIDLNCSCNSLTKLDVSKNTKLQTLECSNNKLSSLDVSNCTKLTRIFCDCNRLTSIDLSRNKALTDLQCFSNQLTKLDLSQNTKLQCLVCMMNKISSLDVSKCVDLSDLHCNENKLTKLDVSNNAELLDLHCEKNKLTRLDLSSNKMLYALNCSNNQLTSLDLSKNTRLEQFWCDYNHLTSLDLSKNTDLIEVYASYNKLELTTTTGKVPYKSLPGFDISKASDIRGAKAGKTAFIVTSSGTITYLYNAGQDIFLPFSIKVTYPTVKITSATLSKTSFAYTGKAIKPKVTVKAKVDGKAVTLKKDADYTVTYKNNVNAGTASVTVKGAGNYKGTITRKFTITPVKILKVTLSKTSYKYDGKAHKPTTTVTTKVDGKLVTLKKGTDYTVKYENNTAAGTATVTVTGKGNYKGTLTKTFKIVEK